MIRIINCLTPRLNYSFSLKDLWFSIKGILKSGTVLGYLNSLFGTDNIYYVNHARTGIRIALNSLQLPANANIGVQAFNCKTVFNAIKTAGYRPIFIDINTDFQICLTDLERKKNSIDALVLTHTFGIPGEFDRIRELLPKIPIIEDCAHGFLSEYKKNLLGKYGDIAVFSIGKGKFPSVGHGGFVIINNIDYDSNFKLQASNLLKPKLTSEIINVLYNLILAFLHLPLVYAIFTSRILRPIYDNKNYNEKSDLLETKMFRSNFFLLSKKLNEIERNLESQKLGFTKVLNVYYLNKVPRVFTDKLISCNGIMVPVINSNPVNLINYFRKNGIEIGRHFSNSIEWAEKFGYQVGDCPNTEDIVKKILVFPCHSDYKKIDRIVELLISYENIN